MDQADVVLLERWVERRDAEAFQALVRRHSALVFSVCRRVLGDAARAEDVTQECFLKLAMGDAKPGAFLGPWLHKMATRRCLDTLRSEGRRRAREERYVAQGPQSVEVRWETLEPLIDEALAQLPERYRVAVTAHFLEGLTHEEVAQRLGIPRYTVSYRISRGLERLGVWLRSRGVNVASGVLIARLGEMPLAPVPPDLAASLSKMALTCAARAVPHVGWVWTAVTAYKVIALVAVMSVLGVAYQYQPFARSLGAVVPPVAVPTGERLGQFESVPRARAEEEAAKSATFPQREVVDSVVFSPASTPSDATFSCAVNGRVEDTNGQPISNALAQLFLTSQPEQVRASTEVLSARTDRNGAFRIAGIAYDRLQPFGTVAVSAEGFMSAGREASIGGPGDNDMGSPLVLREGVTVVLKVLGGDGAPMPKARVHVLETLPLGLTHLAVEADDAGLFRVGLPSGHVPEERNVTVRVITREWGEAFFKAIVRPDRVTALRMPASTRVTGRVVRADGGPATGVCVKAILAHTKLNVASTYESLTDDNGNYNLPGLPPDCACSVWVDTFENGRTKVLTGRHSLGVLAPGSTIEHDFCLAEPMRVRGTVTGDRSGQPMKAGFFVGYVQEGTTAKQSTPVQADGTYELELFSEGRYRIYPIPPEGECGNDLSHKYGRTVDAALGSEQTLDLKAPDTFSLAIRLLNEHGEPLSNHMVQTFFDHELSGELPISSGVTDDAGRFRFAGFPAGKAGWFVVIGGSGRVETGRVVGEPGVDYPEETVVSYEQAGLSGVALGPDGKPLADCRIAVRMELPGVEVDGARVDATSTVVYVESDAAGVFTVPSDVPATFFNLVIHASDREGRGFTANVGGAECVAGQVLELGTLTFTADANAGAALERISVPFAWGKNDLIVLCGCCGGEGPERLKGPKGLQGQQGRWGGRNLWSPLTLTLSPGREKKRVCALRDDLAPTFVWTCHLQTCLGVACRKGMFGVIPI
ncbi:MAG: sigma-70 family RNA polymerase sigma factor [FCB group bacterium]|jgi:RNA polymerase sigma factor (sigma-70 family)|nr:sigma-70 family RNA polymerase sigma factor [FCB group bacterium]